MKKFIPLFLGLSISSLVLSAEPSDPEQPPRVLVANEITDWENLTWRDAQGAPQTPDEDDVLILGRAEDASMPRYTLSFPAETRCAELHFAQRADWELQAAEQSFLIITGKQPLAPKGTLTLGLELFSHHLLLDSGESLIVGAGGSASGVELYAKSATLQLLSGINTWRSMSLMGDSRLSLAGTALLEVGELTLSNRSVVQAGELSIKPVLSGGKTAVHVIELAAPDHHALIRSNSIEAATMSSALLQLVGSKGQLSQCSLHNSLIELTGEGSELIMKDITLNKVSVYLAPQTSLQLENLTYHISCEYSWDASSLKEKDVTVFGVTGWEVASEQLRLSGSLHLLLAFYGEAKDNYKVLRKSKQRLGILIEGLPQKALAFTPENITLTLDDSMTWVFDGYQQDDSGDAILLFKQQ